MSFWAEQIDRWANQDSKKIAIADERHQLTFSDMRTYSRELARELMAAGASSSDRVVVVLGRSAISALVLVTLLQEGIVALFLDPKSSLSELQKVIEGTRPQFLITNVPQCKTVSCVSPIPLSIGDEISLCPILSHRTEFLPPDLKWLLHTSGSTGEVKAVMISEENLIARANVEVADFGITEEDVLLNCLPFSHDLGLNQLLTCLVSGATLRIKTNPFTRLSQFIEKNGITGVTGTPLLWVDCLRFTTSDTTIKGLKYFTISGGQLSSKNRKALRDLFPGAKMIRTYGQTETFRTFLNDEFDGEDMGRVVQGAEIEISSDGELLHYGKTTCLGYLFQDAPLIYSEAFGRGIRTSDVFIPTAKGKYIFQGRKNDVIKRFEQRFHLHEVEHALQKFHEVLEAVAVTVPAPENEWRQLYLGVFVVLKPGHVIDPSELLQQLKRDLSYFKHPDVLIVVDQIPMTSSYKPDKASLKEWLRKEVKLC